MKDVDKTIRDTIDGIKTPGKVEQKKLFNSMRVVYNAVPAKEKFGWGRLMRVLSFSVGIMLVAGILAYVYPQYSGQVKVAEPTATMKLQNTEVQPRSDDTDHIAPLAKIQNYDELQSESGIGAGGPGSPGALMAPKIVYPGGNAYTKHGQTGEVIYVVGEALALKVLETIGR